MLTASFCAIALLIAQDARSGVRQELDQYYQTGKWPLIWRAEMKNLASTNADIRCNATTRLVVLLDEALKDEKSGKARWQASPVWGEGATNQGSELRRWIATPFAKGVVMPETLPLVQWLLENEPQPDLQETVAAALAAINGQAADELRVKLVLKPHSNAIVMGMLLAQLRERKLALPADRLKDLCNHHRKVIRGNARKLNEALNGPDPGKYEPMQAFKSPPVRKTLDELQALLIDLPSKDAEFVEVTMRYLDKDVVKETETARGWVLKQDKAEVTIFSPHGAREVYRDKEKTRITVSERVGDSVRFSEVDVVTSVLVTKRGIEGFAEEIATIRAEGNKDFELSERGGLTGQFQGQGASLQEVILAAWLDRAGKAQLAASILLPALDTLYEDRHIVDMTRHRLSDQLGHRMLAAFAGDRDYEKALKLAQSLVEHYPKTQFFEYAKRLNEQLPRRMDDFKTLKLPMPTEWAELKKKMSRKEQIDFLCRRLQLLNCFQDEQPGGYLETEKQYAEPCGLTADAAWGLGRGKTEVINPVVELTGLKLTISDIPALSPFLRDDWYLLIISFWRDFDPSRHLARSRPYLARWINAAAQHDLCELDQFEKMSPVEQEKHIQRIFAWVDANKSKSQQEQFIEGLQAEVRRGADWQNVSERIEELVEKKVMKALPLLERYLSQKDRYDYFLPLQLRLVQSLDPPKALEWTNRLLENKNSELRMQMAMIVLGKCESRTTDELPIFDRTQKERVVPVLAKLLEKGSWAEIGDFATNAVRELLKLGTKEAVDAARGILRNKYLHDPEEHFWDNRPTIVTQLAKAGFPEGYQFYLELLDVKGNEYEGFLYTKPVAELAVEEVLGYTVFYDPALKAISKIKDPSQQRLAIRQWLQDKRKGVESR
jgi:hypothetical protein